MSEEKKERKPRNNIMLSLNSENTEQIKKICNHLGSEKFVSLIVNGLLDQISYDKKLKFAEDITLEDRVKEAMKDTEKRKMILEIANKKQND